MTQVRAAELHRTYAARGERVCEAASRQPWEPMALRPLGRVAELVAGFVGSRRDFGGGLRGRYHRWR